jgi:Arc/MetJ-type ribon-helix-helix transcriptional regulator
LAIVLNSDQELRIERKLRDGAYQTAGEVIFRALDLLHEHQAWSGTERVAIEAKISRGIQELDRGESVPEDKLS